MFTTPSAVDVLQAIRESLANDVMPELQTDRTRVTVAMIDTMLVSLQRRIPLEQQWMADECNRMRVILKEAASELAHDTGAVASAIRLLAEGASEIPEFPPISSFDEISAAYRTASRALTELIGHLNELAGHDAGRANPLLERARAYINLRCQRDMAAVFAMDAGLVGRG